MTLIPFNAPYSPPDSMANMKLAIESEHLSGDGHFTKLCSRRLEAINSMKHALLTTSCTHALELIALLLDIKPGDEVILPSFTFVSTANAFVLRGARPVFAEIRDDTFNIDERLLEALITPRTKAIVVVHYAGVACQMDKIMEISNRLGVPVIEDNAHGFGGTFQGSPLGSFGIASTLSFHETKNIQCGEGGALLLSDPDLNERAEMIREKGTNRSRFFRGQVDKYTWVEVGSSYLPSELLAAYLWGQLENMVEIQNKRMRIWDTYRLKTRNWAEKSGFGFQHVPDDCQQPAHLFALLAPDLATRSDFISHMVENDVKAVFHYVPLHSSPMGASFGQRDLPITDSISERLVRLPLYPGMSDDQLTRVIDVAISF